MRWPTYSIRSLLLFMAVASLPMIEIAKAHHRSRIVNMIEELGGVVTYEGEPFPRLGSTMGFDGEVVPRRGLWQRWTPAWLIQVLGKDCFYEVVAIQFVIRSNMRFEFGDAECEQLRVFDKIELLRLDCTEVTNESLATIGSFQKLRGLDLNQTRVTDDGLPRLAGLKSLKTLILYENQITSAGITHLAKFSQLEWLALSGTQVNDAAIPWLQNMNLKRLEIQDTNISNTASKALSESMPNCSVKN